MPFSRRHYLNLLDRAGRAGYLLREDEYDAATDTLVIKSSQDVEPILDNNRELSNPGLSGDGYSPSRELRRVASIPNIVIEQWLMEGINICREADWPKVKRRLNDGEWSKLRTSTGRL